MGLGAVGLTYAAADERLRGLLMGAVHQVIAVADISSVDGRALAAELGR